MSFGKLAFTIFLAFSAISAAHAQDAVCQVYVVDSAMAEQWHNTSSDKEQTRLAKAAQTLFPEFHPTVGEEETTTKTYRFPRSKLIITASVFYTDESLGTSKGADSIMVAITVAPKRVREALSVTNNAVAETAITSRPYAVRAKKWLRVNGRLYVVGIECRDDEKPEPKD